MLDHHFKDLSKRPSGPNRLQGSYKPTTTSSKTNNDLSFQSTLREGPLQTYNSPLSKTMEPLYESKAGPSAEQEWSREVPRWRRNIQALVKTIAIIAALAVGYVAFVHMKLDGQKYSWFWDLDDSYGAQAGVHASSKGSQYLLGVGKADITGYITAILEARVGNS